MAAKSEIKVNLTGDSTGLQRAAKDAKNSIRELSDDAKSRLDSIQQAMGIVGKFAAGFGIVAAFKAVVSTVKAYVDKLNEARDAWIAIGKVSAEAIATAKGWEGEQKASGLNAAEYQAIKDAATEANIPVSQLNETIKSIASQGGGLREIADALGMSAEKVERFMNAGSGAMGAGLKISASVISDSDRKKQQEAAREGINSIGRRMQSSDAATRTAAWMEWLDATGGNMYFNEFEKSNTFMGDIRGTNVDVGLLRKYAGQMRSEWEYRNAERELAASAEREAAEEKKAAEEEKRRTAQEAEIDRKEAERASKERVEQEKQAAEAAKETERRTQKASEAFEGMAKAFEDKQDALANIRVSAPESMSQYGSVGGLYGNDPVAMNAEKQRREIADAVKNIESKYEKIMDNWKTILAQTAE